MSSATGHYGFTGPTFIGPTGAPGWAGATGAGATGTVGTYTELSPPIHLGDGVHEHRQLTVHVPPPNVISVDQPPSPAIATPLEGAVAVVAVGGAVSTVSATVWYGIRGRRRDPK